MPRARAPVLSGAPKPLALDLSPSGLIVRVRSVLGGALGSEAPAAPAAALPIPGPSTALLERGAMLEAFSVAHAYADSLASGRNARDGGVAAASHAPPAPGSAPVQLALWWAWLALPLLLAAIRFYL